PIATGTTQLTYTVRNTGNIRLQARQHVQVAGPFGWLARSAALDDLPEILPGGQLTVQVPVDGLWPMVRLAAAVDLQPFTGTDQPPLAVSPVTGSTDTWAWPVGQGLVLVGLIAAFVVDRMLRRRRQRAVEA